MAFKPLVVCVGLLALALQVAAFHGLRHDDAYITYRYAQNLATGNGLVFNLGDRIMGSTAPGHALLATLAYAILGKQWLPDIMSGLGCIGWSAQALAVVFLLRRATGEWIAALIGCCVAVGAAMSANWVALETNLALAATLWGMVLALDRRWASSGLLCGVAALFRPDACLAAALLGAPSLFRNHKDRRRFVPWFLAITMPWILFALVYFGSAVPQSAVAKIRSVGLTEYLLHAVLTPAATIVPFNSTLTLRLAVWLTAVVGSVHLIRRNRALWILPTYVVLHLGAYSVLRPPTEHVWHLYPAILVLAVLSLSSISAIGRCWVEKPNRWRVTAAVLALVVLIGLYAARTDRLAREHENVYWFGARDAAYRALSEYLVENAAPTDVVATYEIGTIGYYSELRIHDWFGLVVRDPDILPPGGCWMVSFWPDLTEAGGAPPRQTFQRAGFTAYLYDLRKNPLRQLDRMDRPTPK